MAMFRLLDTEKYVPEYEIISFSLLQRNCHINDGHTEWTVHKHRLSTIVLL
jgi:hypothetical protein